MKYRPSAIADKKGSLYFQITRKRIVRYLNTGHKIFASEWDATAQDLRLEGCDESRAKTLAAIHEHIKWDRLLLEKTLGKLASSPTMYSTSDIAAAFGKMKKEHSFQSFMQAQISQLGELKHFGTKNNYSTAQRSFTLFRRGNDLPLDGIDSDLMMHYEAWLKERGVSKNTISFYMRILRACYNRAVEKGVVEQHYPFRHVYTGVETTPKRAIPMQMIKRIKSMDLSDDAKADFARDIFLFSFYTRGMSFVDMAFLKKKNLHSGILTYRRHKTGQMLKIKWEKAMQEIIDKYDTSHTSYLLPIIREDGTDVRRQYASAIHLVNMKLKSIGKKAGLTASLTTYVSRHSWASIARSKSIPLAVISEGMGHNSERTTRIYLKSIESSIVDNANRAILNDL